MKNILALTLCLLFSCAYAQDISSQGKDFYLAFIYPTYNDVVDPDAAEFFSVDLYISSAEDNTVSVSYFDQGSNTELPPETYEIKARLTIQVPLDIAMMKQAMRCGTGFLTCHITSQKPVSVQYMSAGANSGGSYLALPVSAWGKEYTVASYKDNGAGKGAVVGPGAPLLDTAAGVFVVISANDDTKVTIVPSGLTCDGHIGVHQGLGSTGTPVPYTVTLDRGESYTVRSFIVPDSGDDDISASIVKADKPIAVISGHENALIDGSDVAGFNLDARDFMVEQMIPTEFWDHTGYITVAFIDSPQNNGEGVGDHARVFVSDHHVPAKVVADRNGTKFEKFPQPYGEPQELMFSEFPVHFFADTNTKFSLVQYDIRNHSTQRTTPPYPTPSMMTIIPRSRWANEYMWYVPPMIDDRLQAYYIHLIGPKDGAEFWHEASGKRIRSNWHSDSMRLSVNGSSTFTGINGVGSQGKRWSNIPGHPDLQAITYRVSPGTSYYVRGPIPFMIYHFGSRAFDAFGALGDFDGDEHFFSYALPLGMVYRSTSADVKQSDEAKLSIQLIPNPARDRVAVDVNLERSEIVSIKLFDVLGREMKAASYSGTMPGWNSFTLDLQGLAKGTYIAIITLGEHVETRSLIVE